MNTVTPRVFIAATRQNDGKTTSSLGMIAALQNYYPRIGYIKPVGQRFVEIRRDADQPLGELADFFQRGGAWVFDAKKLVQGFDKSKRKYLMK